MAGINLHRIDAQGGGCMQSLFEGQVQTRQLNTQFHRMHGPTPDA
jgi:hypothetical protein